MNFRQPVSSNLQSGSKIKVMIIDDSAVIRGLITRWIEPESDIDLVGIGTNGLDGVTRATKLAPDVIILDIEMPQMDGIEALPLLLKAVPGVRIIMASAITTAGAQITIKALSLGATDYIAKPSAGVVGGADDYRNELIAKLRALGPRKETARQNSFTRPLGFAPRTTSAPANSQTPAVPAPTADTATKTQPFRLKSKPEALFIGSSTGGPEALKTVISGLAGKVNVPVFITQHMPALFTKTLAEHLSKTTGANVIEVTDNLIPRPGNFYLAQGGKHMVVNKVGGGVRIELNDDAPENFCKPAVDVLFRSANRVYGDKAMAVILTGMGHDGRDGAKQMSQSGSFILAQDEATSVVWGMPGAVANAGIANDIKPLNTIATTITNILRGVAP